MMRNLVKVGLPLLGAALVAFFGSAVQAGGTVDFSGEVRIRHEGSDRSFVENVDSSWMTLQRTRLRATATNDKGAMAVIELQDSRMWGEENGTLVDAEGVDMYQGYVAIDCTLIPNSKLYLGRQAAAYGQQRVIGTVGWHNVGRALDAARLRMNFDANWVDVAYAKVAEDAAGAPTDTKIIYAYGHVVPSDMGLVFEPFLVHFEVDPGQYALMSIGDYAKYKTGRLKIQQDFVLQSGTSFGADQSAYLIAGELAIDLSANGDGKVGIIGGYSLYSGDDPEDDNDSAYFQILPTAHKFHGYMDLAMGLAGSNGLQDIFGKGWIKLPKGAKALAAVHIFSTDIEVGDESALGNEIDVVFSKAAPNGATVAVGGGMFMPGDLAEAMRGSENAMWGFVQGTVAF